MVPTQSQQCKTCSAGQPPGAKYCRTCGRPLGRTGGRAGAPRVVSIGIVALLVLLLGAAMVALRSTRQSQATTARHFAALPQRSQPPPPEPVQKPSFGFDPPSARTDAVAGVRVRPGDTDLWGEPLAVYAGGPPSDRLTVHGLRIGLPVSDVPAGLLGERAGDHLVDTGGNLYAVDDGRIGEVHIRDPELLTRLPIDGTRALIARFGEPTDVYTGDGDQAFPTFLYPDRGIHVRWDNAAEKILEVVLVRPTRR